MNEKGISDKVLLILLAVAFLIVIALGGFLILKTRQSPTSTENSGVIPYTPIPESQQKLNTQFVFQSQIPGILINYTDTNKTNLTNYLGKLNLLPFESRPFIGVITDPSIPQSISPKKVTVIFKDMNAVSQDEAQDSSLAQRVLLTENGFDIYIVASFNKDSGELTMPIYLNIDNFNKSQNKNLFLTNLVLESIFLNFRLSPVVSLGENPTEVFYKAIGQINNPVLEIAEEK